MMSALAHVAGRIRQDGLTRFTGLATAHMRHRASSGIAALKSAHWRVKKARRKLIANLAASSPWARRVHPESAGVAHGLSLMVSGRFGEALRVWGGLCGVLVGERLQVAHAGRLVCGWVVDPEGFRRELAEAKGLVAPSGVVSDTVVYSAIVGAHDVSWPAGGVIPGASYVRFTDDEDLESWGVWSNRRLEFLGGSPVRSARWVKTHPHMLFPESRWVVWLDGNVIPVSGLEGLLEEFKESGLPMAAITHPTRSTVDEEILECVRRGKDTAAVLHDFEARLGSDPGVGLWETNVCFFDLHHPKLRPLLSKWWSLIEGGSHRDQVSLPFAVASVGVNLHALLSGGLSTRSDERFALIHHGETAFFTAAQALPGIKESPEIARSGSVASNPVEASENEPILERASR